MPEKFFKRDPFHTFKQAIGCSFLSSSIVLLCELGYFPGDSEAVPEQLSRAYADFAFWCKNEWAGRTMQSLKTFTKELLHWPRRDCYPSGRFRGGDCMLMCRWLQHAMLHGFVLQTLATPRRQGQSPIAFPLEVWHKPMLQAILKACGGGINFSISCTGEVSGFRVRPHVRWASVLHPSLNPSPSWHLCVTRETCPGSTWSPAFTRCTTFTWIPRNSWRSAPHLSSALILLWLVVKLMKTL